jgi:hypothetical protein
MNFKGLLAIAREPLRGGAKKSKLLTLVKQKSQPDG